ncbi:MAG: 3-dehydroquinate dehydratase [Bacteroidales bacterium]|jgi:3-dehydroquinate dehydratase-2|nr:3-dehydroquinate dehydratase [Bacteroidales bacterium]MDD3165798.1 3-dehydroquinate dehydratase [Bacteroidales bacterium]MDD4771116.1 3-dehydroquinate dehydratase [Bacteroidales bacterium]HKL93384.1 type II 3-dehydroquinate dehydratase [Bacteroidales bacterium]
MVKITIINGPNLNLLGKREPEIYGHTTFESYFERLKNDFPTVRLDYFQSNHEGSLIDKIQEIGFEHDGILLNAGGYTHTSIALGDCIKAVQTPVIEVHISDPAQREAFRHISYIAQACKATVAGFGLESYRKGLQALLEMIEKKTS